MASSGVAYDSGLLMLASVLVILAAPWWFAYGPGCLLKWAESPGLRQLLTRAAKSFKSLWRPVAAAEAFRGVQSTCRESRSASKEQSIDLSG